MTSRARERAKERVVRAATLRFAEHLAFHGGDKKAAHAACYTVKARSLWKACAALARKGGKR